MSDQQNTDAQFIVQKRGYNPLQVQQFIQQLHARINNLTIECEHLEQELLNTRVKLQRLEGTEEAIKFALINANLAADKILVEANEKAKLILMQAEESIDAEKRRTQITEAEIHGMKERMKYILQSQLALLEENE